MMITPTEDTKKWIAIRALLVYLGVIMGIACLSFLVVGTWLSINIRSELLDCTTEAGECYVEGQERTAMAVQELIDTRLESEAQTRAIVVAAIVCADQPHIRAADTRSHKILLMQRCIEKEVGQHDWVID